jgi:hypothetical protein
MCLPGMPFSPMKSATEYLLNLINMPLADPERLKKG